MKNALLSLLALIIFPALGIAQQQLAHLKTDLQTPTARIPTVALITDHLKRDSADAQALIHAKVILPLAMQRHDRELFESILAKDFLYQGEEAFLNREDYIRDRVNGKWTITDVAYENVILRFYGKKAILTYRNIVQEIGEDGKPATYTWFWTDVWVREKGRWMLQELRAIN